MIRAPTTRAAAVACAGAFIAALSTSLVAVAAPVIARDLGASRADVSWVLTAYLLALSAALATAGRVADLFGRRRVYLTGFAVFAAASLLCALAPTLPLLVAARVVQALGGSVLMATGPAIITQAVPPDRRGRGLGLQLAATYVGLTIGPTASGFLVSAIGWHAIFVVVAAAGALGAVVAAALLPADAAGGARRQPIDGRGALLFALGLAGVLVALRGKSTASWVAALVGVAALAAFVRHAARHPAPVLPLSLLRTPSFAFGVVGAMLLYVVTFVLAWLLPFHLQNARHFDPAHAGALMTAQPATMAVIAPLSGAAADRFGPRGPCVAGMLTIAGGMALVALVARMGDAPIALSLAVVGVGAGLFVAPNNATIMASAPRERQGTAGALAATARNVGMACGVALAGVLGDALAFRGALFVASGLALVGAALGAVRPAASTR